TRKRLEIFISSENDIMEAIEQFFGTDVQMTTIMEGMKEEEIESTGIELQEDVHHLRDMAFEARDQQVAFQKKLAQVEGDANITEAMAIYGEARKEFYDERYGDSIKLIDKAHERLSESQSASTRLKALYESASVGLVALIYNNLLLIAAFAATAAAAGPVAWKKIRINALSSEIENLKIERGILEGLVKEIQTDYFEKMTLPENTYYLRLRKFTEMIRDIDSRLPLVKEELDKESKRAKRVWLFFHLVFVCAKSLAFLSHR
ncbi:MAG: hypothetical protein HZB68_02695, partial [Candidatus Aenigmarchaeota archaeon]|nr:hypothetical protein [Candidatus Aenigmarchaeota archaeon]